MGLSRSGALQLAAFPTSAAVLGEARRRAAMSRRESPPFLALGAQQHVRRLADHSGTDSCLLVSGHPRLLLAPSWVAATVASWHGACRNWAACLCPSPRLALACPVQETTCSGQVSHLLSRLPFLPTFWPGVCPYHVLEASSSRVNLQSEYSSGWIPSGSPSRLRADSLASF